MVLSECQEVQKNNLVQHHVKSCELIIGSHQINLCTILVLRSNRKNQWRFNE